MTNFIKFFLLIVNIVLFVLVLLFVAFGIYEQLTGPAQAKKLLKVLNIPLSYNQIFIIGFVCAIIMVVLYRVRSKINWG